SHGVEWMQERANRLSSLVWFLTLVFTAGPVRILRMWDLLRSCLPMDPELERRMESLLLDLRSRNQWIDASCFHDRWDEMSALIRTGHVEFSSIKGRVRACS